ncbi:hypothetical protein BBK36DRAFT_1169356 [Trichoderma citrinoviride]|uniref:Uncharacterized protein n=1 Tax=Trichoderma citrinoviride TaxID=58853 RepID=A0A2T4B8I6_9HYPO|nr:hypothetical protein BBK36DRAFT_1169356 [Trichoderma citrinoviride]PTB65647.1 hypothetical protein BBK36DRAFT_1169356 [Trichoderma citrinoviride]
MDFAPYQSSPPEHARSPISSPRASADLARRPFSPSFTTAAAAKAIARSPPPLQHPQPQRAWSGDLDGAANSSSFLGGANGSGRGSSLWGFGSGSAGLNSPMPGAYPAEVSEFDTSLGIRLDYEACLAYLAFPPVGAVILLILERNSDYVRFHAWQSALLFTAIMVFHVLFSWSSFLSWIFFLGDLVLIGFLSLKAYQDAEILDRYEVPFFGRIASRFLDDE